MVMIVKFDFRKMFTLNKKTQILKK